MLQRSLLPPVPLAPSEPERRPPRAGVVVPPAKRLKDIAALTPPATRLIHPTVNHRGVQCCWLSAGWAKTTWRVFHAHPPSGKQRCLADLRLVQPHPTRLIYRTAETLDAAAYQQVCWATASSARPPLWQAWRPVDFRHTLGARAGPPSAASEGNRLTHQTGRGIPPHAGQRAQEHRANASQVHGVSHALPGVR